MQNFTIVSLANFLAVSAVKIVPQTTTDSTNSMWDLNTGMPVIDLLNMDEGNSSTANDGSMMSDPSSFLSLESSGIANFDGALSALPTILNGSTMSQDPGSLASIFSNPDGSSVLPTIPDEPATGDMPSMINPFGEVSTVEVSSPNNQSDQQALAQLENLEKLVSDMSQSLEYADLSGPYPEDKIMRLKEIMKELGAIIDSNDEPARSRA